MTQADVLDRRADGAARVYALTGGTELLGEYQDSAYEEPKYLVQRVDGQAMQLPRLLYRVACSLDGRDVGRIAEDLNRELDLDLTADQVTFLVEERLRPAGLIAADPAGTSDAEPGAVPMPVRSDLLLALRYRAGVIPGAVATRIGDLLRPLFARPVWMSLVAAFVAVDVAIVARGGLVDQGVAGVQAVVQAPVLLLVLMGLTLAAGAFHEFGHVTACRYGGARPGDIGVGLYIVWPALYSDVTASYRLDRVGRLRTDLGGIYFDTIVMAVLGLVYLRTGEPWLLIALVGMHVETAWQLLPSIRLDGYYILADLVGVPDLFGYVKPALLSAIPGRQVHPRVAELRPRARRLVVLWVLAVVPTLLAWLAVFVIAAPRLIPAAWQALTDYLEGLDVAVRTGDLVTTTLGVFQLMLLALPWVGTVLVLWMLIDILGQKRRARGAAPWLAPATRTALRRAVSLTAVVGIGGLLVARVAAVADSHPPTPDEARVVDAAVAAVHGGQGSALGVGEWLASAQIAGYATLTGAFEGTTSALAGARQLSVLATAVLVACLVFLVLTRRLRPLAVAVPLAAVLAMGPAVTELATVGPSVLGAAEGVLGALLLARARRSAVGVLGVLLLCLGVATEPLLAVPLAACAAVSLVSGDLAWERPAWWPAAESRGSGSGGGADHPGTGRHRAPRGQDRGARPPRDGSWDPRRCLVLALLVLVGSAGAALTAGRVGAPFDGTERTLLVVLAVVVAASALTSHRFRPPAIVTAAVALLAAVPWPGAGAAALLTLVLLVVLTAVLVDAVVRLPVPQRPHPLLRGLVVVPAVVLVLVGALFRPAEVSALPSGNLAATTTGTAGTAEVSGGAVAPSPR